MPTRHGSTSREVKLPGEKHRGRLEDLVRPAQLVVLTPQSTDLLALQAAEQLGAGARIGLSLAQALAQRLGILLRTGHGGGASPPARTESSLRGLRQTRPGSSFGRGRSK